MRSSHQSAALGVAVLLAGSLLAPAGQGSDVNTSDPAGLLEVFAKRQTVRRYRSDPVPDEHLRRILDAARRAPTCMNQQPWKFLVVRNPKTIASMKKATLDRLEKYFASQPKDPKARENAIQFTSGYFTAPVYVVVLVDMESSCSGYAIRHDGPMAAGYLMLAARAYGYGTAYLTDGIPMPVVREVLNIPKRYEEVCITPIGVPDGWPKPTEKRKLEEMVVYETLEGDTPLKPIPYNP